VEGLGVLEFSSSLLYMIYAFLLRESCHRTSSRARFATAHH